MGAVERIGVWLHETLGTPDGPNHRLVAAWDRADWDTVIRECDAWLNERPILLSSTQSDEERVRIASDAFQPVLAVKAVAFEMTVDAETRLRRRTLHADRLLNELDLATVPPATDAGFRLAAQRIATAFEQAALYDIDLSRSPEEQS
jgi:transposase-like protein